MISNKKTNYQAFTLMELMIVIVIIGILSAIGMVMFGGQAEKAKIAVAKSNHKSATKYIKIEVMKCDLGETSVMEGNLNCSSVTGVNIAKAAVAALSDFKNPYNAKQTAIVNYSVGTGADDNAGLIGIVGRNTTSGTMKVNVNSCVKIPCNPGENRIHSTLTFW